MMATEDYTGPARGLTEDGFSRGAPPPAPRPPFPWKKVLLTGVAVSLALGLAFGLLARPKLATREDRPMAAVPQTASAGQLGIVVKPVPPAPVKAAAGRLEVLPGYLAQAAPKPPAPEPSFRSAATDAVGDLAAAPGDEEAAEDRPIDCARPADRQEARICRDIGFDRDDDGYRSDEPPRYAE